jgi:nitrogen fixation-related uncharacterized protein
MVNEAKKQEYAVSYLKANLLAIIVPLPVVIPFIVAYLLLWGGFEGFFDSVKVSLGAGSFIASHLVVLMIYIVMLIGGIVVHELIHGAF